jgi:hypothetical protein
MPDFPPEPFLHIHRGHLFRRGFLLGTLFSGAAIPLLASEPSAPGQVLAATEESPEGHKEVVELLVPK